jgi:hypothetical protein
MINGAADLPTVRTSVGAALLAAEVGHVDLGAAWECSEASIQ